jgi:hypothetical protein
MLNPEKQLIVLLDTASIDVSIGQLTSRCVRVGADISILVRTVLRWAASVHRQGDHRVYIAAALISKFKDRYSDVEAAIWDVAAGLENDRGIHDVEICRVVAELVRSRQFSLGPFLRYLISNGAVSSPHDSTKVGFEVKVPKSLSMLIACSLCPHYFVCFKIFLIRTRPGKFRTFVESCFNRRGLPIPSTRSRRQTSKLPCWLKSRPLKRPAIGHAPNWR